MPYYCLECKKNHANNYKKHWKFKSKVLVTRKKEPDLFSEIEKRFEEFKKQMEKYCRDIKIIKETLSFWSPWIERKHPYWKATEDWEYWANDV